MTFVEKFDCDFEKALIRCGVDLSSYDDKNKMVIAAGISGGADSISLLTALIHFSHNNPIVLKIISVNHNIRPKEETLGDALYVKKICEKNDVFCYVHEIKRGEVEKIAIERNAGIEEAARFLRYKAFENFSQKYNVSFFCVAHNKNDQLETLLMRFLQGSSDKAASGIGEKRGIYIRPLLNTYRVDIEKYLVEQNISWRTDKTNFDTAMLRNRIRNKLIPLLDKEFSGWQKAVICGAEKNSQDADLLEQVFLDTMKNTPVKVDSEKGFSYFPFENFCSLMPSIKRKIIYSLVNCLGYDVRLPYSVVKTVCSWENGDFSKINKKIEVDNICIFVWNGFLCADNKKEHLVESGFLIPVFEEGFYDCCAGRFEIFLKHGKICIKILNCEYCFSNLQFPFLLRSVQNGDCVLSADGSYRNLSKIFGTWHVSTSVRDKIVIMQDLNHQSQDIIAVLGKPFGFSDWIVKNSVE